jgi:hypothetical protein
MAREVLLGRQYSRFIQSGIAHSDRWLALLDDAALARSAQPETTPGGSRDCPPKLTLLPQTSNACNVSGTSVGCTGRCCRDLAHMPDESEGTYLWHSFFPGGPRLGDLRFLPLLVPGYLVSAHPLAPSRGPRSP